MQTGQPDNPTGAAPNTDTPRLITSAMEGFVSRAELASPKHLRCSERTIIRYERQGMPVIVLGHRRLYDPVRVRDWIAGLYRAPEPPKRGRPRKQ